MKLLPSAARLGLPTGLLLLPGLAAAHGGHGLEGLAHDLVHLVWLLNGAALLAVGLVLFLGRSRRGR